MTVLIFGPFHKWNAFYDFFAFLQTKSLWREVCFNRKELAPLEKERICSQGGANSFLLKETLFRRVTKNNRVAYPENVAIPIKGYHIYPKYSDTSAPNHTFSKSWTITIFYPILCLNIAGGLTISVDPDETSLSAASHLGLHCLLRPVCPNTYVKYGKPRMLKFKYRVNPIFRS